MILPKIILGLVSQAFSLRTSKVLAITAGTSYAGFYLFATGIISYYPSIDISQYVEVPQFNVLMYDNALGSSPWIVSYPTPHVVISLPFWALLSTILLAFLLACNVALVAYATFKREACGRKFLGLAFGGLFPSSFGIVGCCSPTLILFLGLASLASLMWKLTAFLTVGSISLLTAGIYFTAKSMIYRSGCVDNRK